ncbi:PREDICTED: uncharacterized protein LOC104792884 isoform X1 [Camelina sativa]|uniref:Uncharacterized protein LOC104792884 isoform X1 n=1 Tax=Camelina sativa TaxID=90675 RepID=A0ABM0ZLK0_CAMSA|nr:PREDICTED: uncharacterized protein LOC104792884 isoform X1 [Camelina sativa]
MYDVMLDEANLWHHEHEQVEPPLRKRKIEEAPPPSPVEDVYFSDEEDPEEQEKYRLQVVESCGFDVDFCNHTYNGIMPGGCSPYDKLFAKAGLHCYNLEKVTLFMESARYSSQKYAGSSLKCQAWEMPLAFGTWMLYMTSIKVICQIGHRMMISYSSMR